MDVDRTMTCVDCGGRTHLITPPREEGEPYLPGDVVVYRCEDCRDRWDVVVPEEPEDPWDPDVRT